MRQHIDNVYLKLGGSLITDKTRAYATRTEIIARLAGEVQEALETKPGLRLLIGHGSGSFGHWAAKPYGTRQGVQSPTQWRGYTVVAAAAARLNRIVTDVFLEAGVPVLSVQPSASARCHDGTLEYMDTRPIHVALAHGLVPLIYGDVAPDDARGGTIISTEDIFLFMAKELCPTRILLLGEVAGVQDSDGSPIPRITPSSLPSLGTALSGSAGTDVTGGMKDKVMQMIQLVQHHPETDVRILTGIEPGLLTRVLLDPNLQVGTRIAAQ
ncbi:MAG: isopentenyl phosphate kinase family protein [Anaerolineae bacterium]|nr:isopentenyl phosphate kinase family protein [Anaerolineae bacterium]